MHRSRDVIPSTKWTRRRRLRLLPSPLTRCGIGTCSHFQPATIDKLHLQYPTSSFTIERSGTAWRLSAPIQQRISQPGKIDDLLLELSALTYVEIADVQPLQPINTPRARITLWDQDGMQHGPLAVGHPIDDDSSAKRFTYVQAFPAVAIFTIDDQFISTLPTSYTELISP